MSGRMYSPFDPDWYTQAFARYNSTADQLFNRLEIINQGFTLPDKDGSRSSVFRQDAVTNNSFNEKELRESLKDIYLNNSHKLIASNHDNVHFYSWYGHWSDVKFIPNTLMCEITLPTEAFIEQTGRDKYKLSQYFRKWVTYTDLMNSWDVFHWTCLLFIDQKIYADFMLRMDDKETIIRFSYQKHWIEHGWPIYFYKFDTRINSRMKIGHHQMVNVWNYKIPVEAVEPRVAGNDHVMVMFNRMGSDDRKDGVTNPNILGDNIEFAPIHDGYIDLSKISKFNKDLIDTELSDYIWMTLVIPRFLHEYPILLPVDPVYRPYQPDFIPVHTTNVNADYAHARAETNNLYVNMGPDQEDWNDGWKNVIRPIVLADAYDNPEDEPYVSIFEAMDNIQKLTIKAADIIESFHNFMLSYTTDEEFLKHCDVLEDIIDQIYEAHNAFLTSKRMELNPEYESVYEQFKQLMPVIKEEKNNSKWFRKSYGKPLDFWKFISPLTWIPRQLVDKYYIATLIKNMGETNIWDQSYDNKQRFRRPIDASDFWIFEYDKTYGTWHPIEMDVEHHFPDVYTLTDPNPSTEENRIFKAFFFYSDTMNVREPVGDIIRATPNWDTDVENFETDRNAVYRDVFMEKFYWLGVKTIYKGIIETRHRWEVLEYVQDNASYKRFNDLFLQSIDPYFSLGMTEYQQSDNFEFPFDDAIAKLKESMTNKFLGYTKVTNFEIYLNRTFKPQYFDYVTKILDDWDYKDRLIRRPRDSFDSNRVLSVIHNMQEQVHDLTDEVIKDLDFILEQIKKNKYNMSDSFILELRAKMLELADNIDQIDDRTTNLDLDIYSIKDINELRELIKQHKDLIAVIKEALSALHHNNPDIDKVSKKIDILTQVRDILDNELYKSIDKASSLQDFDLDEFMMFVYDPAYYDARNHEGDKSLVGYMNQFTQVWPLEVQKPRDALSKAAMNLWRSYKPSKVYSQSEAEDLMIIVQTIKTALEDLDTSLTTFWTTNPVDAPLQSMVDYALTTVNVLYNSMSDYVDQRKVLYDIVDQIRSLMLSTEEYGISKVEEDYMANIDELLSGIINALGYIAGESHKDEATSNRYKAWIESKGWLAYIKHELEIYTKLLDVDQEPNPYIGRIEYYSTYMDAVEEYLATLDHEFIPDKANPTYADVYEVDDVELLTGGFLNEVGNKVYAPNLASFEVTNIDEEVGECKEVTKLNYRKTTFRNPLNQSNPFDSITDGQGIGITFVPKTVNTRHIINDTLVDRIIMRIKDIFAMIKEDIEIINPDNNVKLADNMETIHDIQNEWNEILEFYDEHMSENGIKSCRNMFEAVDQLVEALESFMKSRSECDLGGFIAMYNNFVKDSYDTFNASHLLTPTYVYYDGRMRAIYNQAIAFYGSGIEWNDPEGVKKVVNDCTYELNLFKQQLMGLLHGSYLESLTKAYDNVLQKGKVVTDSLEHIKQARNDIQTQINIVNEIMVTLPPDLIIEHWYEFNKVSVGQPGSGYAIGDIVKLIPELPVDMNGEVIHENESEIMNDDILVRITQVNSEGGVLKAVPLLDYAVPYHLWGSRSTVAVVGSGTRLVLNAYANEVSMFNTEMFMDPRSDQPKPDQFDRNDQFVFKFENIHDLPVDYEVFFGGKQQMNVIVRHEPTENPLHPENIDLVYVNANDVMNLSNSAIEVQDEHYFVYKLDHIEIVDPGMGYSVGQTIMVDAGSAVLKLRVTKLKNTPFKEIEAVELIDGQSKFKGLDPTAENAPVIPDGLDNIDDEFNVGYYDKIPASGIEHSAVNGDYDEEYIFTSKRFDSLDGDDRNATYMYPDIEMPPRSRKDVARNGDPDYHWYLGSREDLSSEKTFNGVMNINPVTDPFIPREDRLPCNKPLRGEYQLIDHVHIHDISADMLTTITGSEINDLVKGAEVQEQSPFTTHDITIDGIEEDKIDGIINDDQVPFSTPTVTVDGHIIKAVDVSNVKDLIYGDMLALNSPPPFIDEHIIPHDPNKHSSEAMSNFVMEEGDMVVPNKASIPQHLKEWPTAMVGNTVIVEQDETMGGHRTMYRVRTYLVTGYIIYNEPELADWTWTTFNINWLKDDYYPDLPSLKARYPKAKWYDSKTYREVQESITDGLVEAACTPRLHQGTYIDKLTVDDLSVYNFTLHKWEDLHDTSRWKLTVYEVESHYGFTLEFLGDGDGNYSYDMRLYLNKIPDTQKRNALLKKPATFNIKASIYDEVDVEAGRYSVNTGRHLRIRKLFPYEQKETFTVGISRTRNMNFRLANYIHYKNELHAEDIIVYNKTLGRYEDLFDQSMFELQFKDDKAIDDGYETQTLIVQTMLSASGEGFVDGPAWAYNSQRGIQIFGRVTADQFGTGGVMSFTPIHCPNPPLDDVTLEFKIYQQSTERSSQAAIMLAEFQTAKVQVRGNGYIQNVVNPMAPLPQQFRIICKYDMDMDYNYEISISKTPKTWKFVKDEWEVFPTFYINDRVPSDRLYILTDKGRMPLVNPATGKPSFYVNYYDDGMEVTFLNIYRKYEQLEIHSVPYPMRSVFTLRRIPQSGYVDLKGKINKPLNKKYFEFWVNGRLLYDEVTIITPTKVFFHGLTSLRNLEIIEINRDPNEYFSDTYLGVDKSDYDRPYPKWDYTTYLDDALTGSLEGDNYKPEEQESLLTPVWQQVELEHPEFKNFPPNRDLEDDIMVKVDDYLDIVEAELSAYQFMITDIPTIEGVMVSGQNVTFDTFGFTPLTDDEIVGMLDEEWSKEIEEGLIPPHSIISEDDYYGKAVRMFDEFGTMVATLDEAAYWVSDTNTLRINHPEREARIIRTNESYDLT